MFMASVLSLRSQSKHRDRGGEVGAGDGGTKWREYQGQFNEL